VAAEAAAGVVACAIVVVARHQGARCAAEIHRSCIGLAIQRVEIWARQVRSERVALLIPVTRRVSAAQEATQTQPRSGVLNSSCPERHRVLRWDARSRQPPLSRQGRLSTGVITGRAAGAVMRP